jgi:tryptophan-rich sensory protein
MGIALYLAWTENVKKRTERGWAIRAFFFQLVLNVVWSIVFFGFHNLWLGVIIILGLWGMILLTMKLFWSLSRSATYLLIPYITWVTFATVLNMAIALLN